MDTQSHSPHRSFFFILKLPDARDILLPSLLLIHTQCVRAFKLHAPPCVMRIPLHHFKLESGVYIADGTAVRTVNKEGDEEKEEEQRANMTLCGRDCIGRRDRMTDRYLPHGGADIRTGTEQNRRAEQRAEGGKKIRSWPQLSAYKLVVFT